MPDEFCPRQITFLVPGDPALQVTATENGGAIDFTLDVLDNADMTADLRALFFDINEAKMGGLAITGGDGLLTESQIDANDVLDLGNGANLKGATKDGFDIGLEWGTEGIGNDDVSGPVHFTLSNTAGDLTLDDIAGQRFGARLNSVGDPDGSREDSLKLMTIAPAAPDANDDRYSIFEDGADGLDDPSKSPEDVVLNVLANDTDADGDILTISAIHEQPDFGTVAISADGKSLIYTPALDYAGTISFEYCVDDGNGGQDNALVTINIAAVADIPIVSIEAAARDAVNEILLTVTATQDDADSSEFIDYLTSSVLPAGVTISPVSVNPAAEPDQIVQNFILTVPMDQDTSFDLTFTAQAQETSNGDEETGTATIAIDYEYNSTSVIGQFTATDQSIWSSGDQFTFHDDRFIGLDTGYFNPEIGGALYAGVEGDIRVGFQSTLDFEGGEIDATSNYDITVETNYNKTVDVLRIDTLALLASALFSTEGPEGSYALDFIYDVFLRAYAGVDIVGLGDEISIGVDFDGTVPLIDINSDDLSGSFDFPPPFDAFSLNFAWPELTTNGSLLPNPGTSSGASNNFLELNVDLDTLITQLIGIPNVFDPPQIGSVFYADFDLLDLDIIGGLNFLQEFSLLMGDLVGTLTFEDGSVQAFTLGDSLQIANASLIDAAGNNDGIVDFTFAVGPEADLTNETDLGFNVGFHIAVLSVELGYDFELVSDSTTLGPLYEDTFNFPVAEISVFNDTFALDFSEDNFAFSA